MKNNSFGRTAYEPFPEAGQYIVDCYEATTWEGKKEVRAHFSNRNVHEKVVRCGNCQLFDGKCKMTGLIVPMMHEWFCAGGVEVVE